MRDNVQLTDEQETHLNQAAAEFLDQLMEKNEVKGTIFSLDFDNQQEPTFLAKPEMMLEGMKSLLAKLKMQCNEVANLRKFYFSSDTQFQMRIRIHLVDLV